MSPRPVGLRRHAIFKHTYRRTVASTPDFHNLDGNSQWAALRGQVQAEAAAGESSLLEIMDSRAGRRDEVLAALEEGRQAARK
jgi:hypothetical protein